MPRSSDEPNDVRRAGRERRPSEKVQAMLDEQQQEKQKQEVEAITKAKRREVSMRKREQASQAAKTDLRVPAAATVQVDRAGMGPPSQLPIRADDAFTVRSVVTPLADHGNPRSTQASPLVSRRGNVPPIAGRTAVRPKAPLPARARFLTRTPSMLNVLEYDAGRDEEEITPDPVIGRKRVRERETTPFPYEWMEYNDDDDDAILYDQPLDHEQPRKRVHRDSTFYDHDENETPEGTNKSHATRRSMCRSPSLGLDALVIAGDSDMPLESEAAVNQNSSPSVKVINNANKGRPKAADYDSDVRAVLETAIEIYCAILLTENPFPTSVQEVDWAKNAWSLAGHHHDIKLSHDGGILKLVRFRQYQGLLNSTTDQIVARSTHLRGQFKSKARPIVTTTFGFEMSADTGVQTRNRLLVSELKQDSAFIFRARGSSLDEHTGLYTNPAIQQVINEVLFKNKSDDGIKWAKYYNPFPRVAFALALTAIECAIDEWASGSREMISFKEDEYSGVFNSHLASLDEFSKAAGKLDLLKKLLEQVYSTGCIHAGVAAKNTKEQKKAIPSRAFLNAIRDYQMADVNDSY
ncbi:hypothetical protein EDD15DRAFT_2369863 [Pisolithus albus]|nr:hypothetical protein EDD15DRAFT_2369863 [Pisolithus albus]